MTLTGDGDASARGCAARAWCVGCFSAELAIKVPAAPTPKITNVVSAPAKNMRALEAMTVSPCVRYRTHGPPHLFRLGKRRQRCFFEHRPIRYLDPVAQF